MQAILAWEGYAQSKGIKTDTFDPDKYPDPDNIKRLRERYGC